jgi:hypothetical protein
MKTTKERLEHLIDKVAADMGDGGEQERLMQHRSMFAALAAERISMSRARLNLRPIFIAAGIAALVLISFVIAWSKFASPHDITFTIGEGSEGGVLNQWIEAPDNATSSVRFEGGTRVSLLPKAEASVEAADSEQVRIHLSVGKINADVKRNGRTKWLIVAGPYTVEVIGTKFSVAWEPTAAHFNVVVERGVVLINGKNIERSGVYLAQGYCLSANRNKVSVEPVASNLQDPRDPANLSNANQAAEDFINVDSDTDSNKGASTNVHRRENAEHLVSEETSWISLYEHKQYRRAVDVAKKIGLSKLSLGLNDTRLWQLIDAARSAGETDLSVSLLTTFRERFSESKQAGIAAFLLGKILYDEKQQKAEASVWFERYLRESPDGLLAEEALGRLVTANRDMGRKETAKRYATEYLKKYPSGSFATISQRAVSYDFSKK